MSEELKELGATQPAPEYTPMADPFKPAPEKEKIYNADDKDDLRAAAAEVDELGGVEPEPVPREYHRTQDGQFTGEKAPEHETISAERAAEDLTRQRDAEVGAEHQNINEAVKFLHDQNLGQAQAQQEAQQPQQQQPQQQQPQQPASDQEALEEALRRPAVRQAMEQQLQSVEIQRQRYTEAAENAFQVAAAGTLSRFSELQGLALNEIPTALKLIERQNPQRYAEMYQAVTAVDRLYQNAQQAKAQEQQIEQARIQMWAANENARFDETLKNEPRETYESVTKNGARILEKNFGVSPAQFQQMVQANPILRSAASQSLIYSAIKAQLAQEAIAQKKVPASVPPMIRPGTSKPAASHSDEEAASALKAFKSEPTVASAQKYLAARRKG